MLKSGTEPFLECSSKGDRRFSAFYAKLLCERNKTIEELYQSFKKFNGDDGSIITGLSIKEAKGKQALNQIEASEYYSHLWNVYFQENPELLLVIAKYNGFSDIFGQPGRCCQAVEVFRIRQLNFNTPLL